MRQQITGRLQGLQRTFAAFTPGQKTIAVIGGLALLLAGVMVFRWASTPAYAPLFTNIAPADASAVVDKLNSAGTPYQLADGGNTILVPQSDVYATRIQLSGEGLPSKSTDGYSLLDNQSLSTSQFQEQTSYKRAIEGEMEKTIEALDSVDTAIVHIAMPQQQLFQSQQQPTTASVLVAVHPGMTLTTEQVQAIVHLVASSVEGLDPKQVTVTDSAGNVLSTAGTGIDSVASTRDQEVKAFEDRMTGSVTSMLDRVVGPGNSAVDVNADLNFDQTSTHTIRYFTTPNAIPLSASVTTEKYKAPGGAGGIANGGVVGPDGQLLQSGTTVPGGATQYQKQEHTSDNAVGQVVEQREAAPGNVQALHVGIVLDSSAPNGKNPAAVQQLVSAALGINPKRGDTVTVTSMPFDHSQQQAAAAALAAAQKADSQAKMFSMARTAGLVLLVAVIFLLAWRRSRTRDKLREQAPPYVVEQLRREPAPATAVLPPVPAAELTGPDQGDLRIAARDEIAALVERQPEEVAQLLRGWLVDAEH